MAKTEKYDLVIIGGGPGGYVAAVRAAQLDMRVACVEKEPRLGGVCLRVGCIPSKALLDSSEYYHLAKERFAEHGIETGKLTLDLPAMMARKDKVVEDLTDNVRKLLERNKIEIVHGTARLAGSGRVEVKSAEDKGRRRAWRQSRSFWRPAASRWRSRASNSTARTSSAPAKPCSCKPCPSSSVLSAAAISDWSWDRSGGGWEPR